MNMDMKVQIAIGVGALLVLLAVAGALRSRTKGKIDPDHFMESWLELQKHCVSRKTWPKAVVEADALLDKALQCKGFKGKTTGERLVAAQRTLSNNESVWFGHKYGQSILDMDVRRLRKQDVLEALHGFRQALRDMGALKVPETASDD